MQVDAGSTLADRGPPALGSAARRGLGVFVNPMYLQGDGADAVLADFERAGATALCTTPKLARIAADGRGVRFPDLHGDGHRRVLERPLWGQRELSLHYRFAFEASEEWFADTPYHPRTIAPGTKADAAVLRRALAKAAGKDLHAYLLVQPFKIPGLAAADAPVRPDGSTNASSFAHFGDPANESIRRYGVGLVLNVAAEFPALKGIVLDWAEFSAYRFDDLFLGVGPASEAWARARGFAWPTIARDVDALWAKFHRLSAADLTEDGDLARHWDERAGTREFLRLKRELIASFVGEVRRALDAHGFSHLELGVRGWPPPWNAFSGIDYAALGSLCQIVSPKLFLFDYAALPRWYAQTILEWNPHLREEEVLDAMVRWLQLPDALQPRGLEKYGIPAPDTPHPVPLSVYAERIAQLARTVRGARFEPFVHAYLPDGQWEEKLRLLAPHSTGLWVQMYEYLSEHKFDRLRQLWARA